MNESHRNAISDHLDTLSEFLDFHSSWHSNIIIVGVEEPHKKPFSESYRESKRFNKATCML